MKKTILRFMIFCCTTFLFMGISIAENPDPTCNDFMQDSTESTCYGRCNQCMVSCDEKYVTPKHDVWGKRRTESNTTRTNRSKCKNTCLYSMESCIKRKRKQQKAQEELESQAQDVQESTAGEVENSLSPSDSVIYKWTDKNGVIHITNNKESIPSEYQEQLEQGTNSADKIMKYSTNVESVE